MAKHYSAPELVIIELRLHDVVMTSDEWETPLLGFSYEEPVNTRQELEEPPLSE